MIKLGTLMHKNTYIAPTLMSLLSYEIVICFIITDAELLLI